MADGITTLDYNAGWCYCHVAVGIATESIYFNLSSEVLNRTSSHMWGRWYFWYTFQVYKIIKSNISSDMNKPCWKLAKACPQSQKLFCFRENNLLVKLFCYWLWVDRWWIRYTQSFLSIYRKVDLVGLIGGMLQFVAIIIIIFLTFKHGKFKTFVANTFYNNIPQLKFPKLWSWVMFLSSYFRILG